MSLIHAPQKLSRKVVNIKGGFSFAPAAAAAAAAAAAEPAAGTAMGAAAGIGTKTRVGDGEGVTGTTAGSTAKAIDSCQLHPFCQTPLKI